MYQTIKIFVLGFSLGYILRPMIKELEAGRNPLFMADPDKECDDKVAA